MERPHRLAPPNRELVCERVRFGKQQEGLTATNPLDLYYLYRKAEGWSAAAIVGAAVLSHWVLDWLVHRPDLPLYDNSFAVIFQALPCVSGSM